MALITCPECGGQVSDSARSCPHCGYLLTDPQARTQSQNPPTVQPPHVQRTQEVMRKTKLEDPEGNMGLRAVGAIAIVIAVFVAFGGHMAGAGVAAVFGVILIAMSYAVKSQSGKCPYCQTPISIQPQAPTFKCPHCKKYSRREDGYLITIE